MNSFSKYLVVVLTNMDYFCKIYNSKVVQIIIGLNAGVAQR